MRPCLRATEHTDLPLSKLSATIRALSSAVKTRRLLEPDDGPGHPARFAGAAAVSRKSRPMRP
ncbi:MAG: hypothetical protein L0Y57_03315 [Beijerinckiaceae bacterium]|nr:hypothetical protein [Beijerinckiaceae bacterium]